MCRSVGVFSYPMEEASQAASAWPVLMRRASLLYEWAKLLELLGNFSWNMPSCNTSLSLSSVLEKLLFLWGYTRCLKMAPFPPITPYQKKHILIVSHVISLLNIQFLHLSNLPLLIKIKLNIYWALFYPKHFSFIISIHIANPLTGYFYSFFKWESADSVKGPAQSNTLEP